MKRMKKIKKILLVWTVGLLVVPWSASALTDPYGYVYTRVNTNSSQPLVLDSKKYLENVRVVLYRLNSIDGGWAKWNAKQYYQENPVFTSAEGQYSFSVPAGKYYLTANKEGHQFYRSKIMDIQEADPVELDIFLPVESAISFGALKSEFESQIFLALAAILVVGGLLVIWLVRKIRKK